MLPDEIDTGIARTSTFSRRFEIIELLYELCETAGYQLIARNPSVPLVVQSSPLDFVLEGLLQLLATEDILKESPSTLGVDEAL